MVKINKKIIYGFTLIELLFVMGIIAVLLTSISFAYVKAIERSRISHALSDIQNIRQAVEQYHADMGFYPPDTAVVDPGLQCEPGVDVGCVSTCSTNCPIGFNTTDLVNKWKGPYMVWPQTPWQGVVYDYDYWSGTIASRTCGAGTVTVPKAIYLTIRNWGLQIPEAAEQYMIDKKMDSDGCSVPNGEILILIKRL